MHERKRGAPRLHLALCLASAVGCAPKALTAKTEPAELESQEEFFNQFGRTMPETLLLQRQMLLSRLK